MYASDGCRWMNLLQWRNLYGVSWQNFLYSLVQLGLYLTCQPTKQVFNRTSMANFNSTYLLTLNLYSHVYLGITDQILQQVLAGEWVNKLLGVYEGASDWLARKNASRNVDKLVSRSKQLTWAYLICKLKKEKTRFKHLQYCAMVLGTCKEMLPMKMISKRIKWKRKKS